MTLGYSMVLVGLSFLMAFGISYLVIPSIIKVAYGNGILDRPSDRKAHRRATPLFGGIGIFLGFVLAATLFVPAYEMDGIRYILAAVSVIFLVGARDDLEPLTPLVKLIGQLIGVGLMVFFADIRLTSFYGLFGLGEMSLAMSYFVSGIVFLFFINAFNLIDGIDALCSSVSIWILSVLGVSFLLMNEFALAVMAFSAAGSTLAFLRFNISPSKIFMGDTGSLVLGAICSVLLIQLIEINATLSVPIFHGSVTIAIGLFILPIYDTCRVFFNRVRQGKWPLDPDKTHLHHLLLDVGLTHMQSTGILLCSSILFLMGSVYLQHISSTVFLLGAFVMAICLTQCLRAAIQWKGARTLRTDP